MRFFLRKKEDVEKDNHPEKEGMVNMYACPNCRAIVMYLYIDDGHTPAVLKCDCCGKKTYSQLSQVRQPNLIWYRPKDIDEIERIADAAYLLVKGELGKHKEKIIKEAMINSYIEHYNKGGLFAKVINL